MYDAVAHIAAPREIDRDAVQAGLVQRRRRLEAVGARAGTAAVAEILEVVDDALERLETDDFGVCERCHDPIETERVAADPLVRVCLDCLTAVERRALERDLRLAAEIQTALLPGRDIVVPGWEGHYLYAPHGAVSGDYLDVLHDGMAGGAVTVFLGDVSGKGVAAALLMSHLHAVFRGMTGSQAPLAEMVARANRLFCAATPPEAFATLVAARLMPEGRLEICNAGHNPPLLLNSKVEPLASHGIPLGLFCDASYTSQTVALEPGEGLLLYTDGLTESVDREDREYGLDSLRRLVASRCASSPRELAECCLEEVTRHRQGAPAHDDLTVMVLRRSR